MEIDVRPSASRFVTRTEWVESRHSFSYGPHYDPGNVAFGVLVAHNDDVLVPGAGFPDHPHSNVDIVTWVVSGALRHTDSTGSSGSVRPGWVQRLSTGSGVRHSEVNAAAGVTHYIQMWIEADVDGPPEYALADAAAGAGEFALVASGDGLAPVTLRQRHAALSAARLAPGESASLPSGEFVHLFVVTGAATLAGAVLTAGDAARITGAHSLAVTASGSDGEQTELLAWAMNAAAWRP